MSTISQGGTETRSEGLDAAEGDARQSRASSPGCLTYAPWPSMNSMVKGF